MARVSASLLLFGFMEEWVTNEILFIGLCMNWAEGVGKGWGCKTQMTSPDLWISAGKGPKDKEGSGSPWIFFPPSHSRDHREVLGSAPWGKPKQHQSCLSITWDKKKSCFLHPKKPSHTWFPPLCPKNIPPLPLKFSASLNPTAVPPSLTHPFISCLISWATHTVAQQESLPSTPKEQKTPIFFAGTSTWTLQQRDRDY